MNLERIDPPLTPEERQAAIEHLHNFIAMVSGMGANDEEVPIATAFLNKLLGPEQTVTKSQWEQMRNRLGDPFDKNTNYH